MKPYINRHMESLQHSLPAKSSTESSSTSESNLAVSGSQVATITLISSDLHRSGWEGQKNTAVQVREPKYLNGYGCANIIHEIRLLLSPSQDKIKGKHHTRQVAGLRKNVLPRDSRSTSIEVRISKEIKHCTGVSYTMA